MDNPVYDLVIGNIGGARKADNPNLDWKGKVSLESSPTRVMTPAVSAVETRAQKKKKDVKTSLKIPEPIKEVSSEQIRLYKESDETLSEIRNMESTGETKVCKDGSMVKYVIKKNLYYRQYSKAGGNTKIIKQLVVPKQLRSDVLKIAHDGVMSGHFGIRKTTDKTLSQFYWPHVRRDVRNYCKSCDTCQKTIPKGRVGKLPPGKMPLIDTPFSRIAIDLIGPLRPPTEEGHRFVLTEVDYAT